MQSYYKAQIWKSPIKLPMTCKKAKPVAYETVKDTDVIKVIDATYRKATLNGVFVISPFVNLPLPTSSVIKIDVLCRWFNHRLISTGLTFKVDCANIIYIENYNGEVVSDIDKN